MSNSLNHLSPEAQLSFPQPLFPITTPLFSAFLLLSKVLMNYQFQGAFTLQSLFILIDDRYLPVLAPTLPTSPWTYGSLLTPTPTDCFFLDRLFRVLSSQVFTPSFPSLYLLFFHFL